MSLQKNGSHKFGLEAIHVRNFRGIKYLKLVDLPQGAPWIFLTGKNGYGKTSLLQAIFIGLFGKQDGKISLVEKENNGVFTVRRYEYDSSVPVGAAYGSNRLKLQAGASTTESDGQGSFSYSLFNQGGVLRNIEEALKNWYYRSQAKELHPESRIRLGNFYRQTVEILKKLMPNILEIQIDVENDQILYYEQDNEGRKMDQPVQFDQLAAGNKSIISMVGDMLLRLIDWSLNLEPARDVQPIRETEGYVIIDELDLHLHPEWQKKLPALLSDIFPNVQFIASSHSPIPFLGAPEGSVFIKVNRSAEDGITAEKLEIDIKNLTPNLILSSPIFGFTEIFPIIHEDGERIRTEDTMEELKQRDRIIKGLKSFLGDDKEKELERLIKP